MPVGAEGRHEALLGYSARVAAELAAQRGGHGAFSTAVADWPLHVVCPRDKAVISAVVGRARAAKPAPPSLVHLPCDMLRGASARCAAPLPPEPEVACADLPTQVTCLASRWNCSWDASMGHCVQPPPRPTNKGGCYRGAKPPCVYAKPSPCASRWRLVRPRAPIQVTESESESGNLAIVLAASGECLTVRPGPISLHTMLTVGNCSAPAPLRQRWISRASANSFATAADERYVLNVADDVSAPLKELQLFSGAPAQAANQNLRLSSDGQLEVALPGGFGGCVTVCRSGDPDCGGL
jgi:hypothetical protein